MAFSAVLLCSVMAVAQVAAICAAGAVLRRKGVLRQESLGDLSRVLIVFSLPCLLFARVSESISVEMLSGVWCLVVAAVGYVAIGFVIASILVHLARPEPAFRRGFVLTVTFGNSGYVPMTLISALAAATPALSAVGTDAAAIGVSYIAVYLIAFTPLLWGVGYPYLLERPRGEARRRSLIPPPLVGMGLGVLVGLTPLHDLFIGSEAPLRWLHGSASMVGWLTLPCAMLILGANLAAGPQRQAIAARTVLVAALGRLVLVPAAVFAIVIQLRNAGLLPDDPLLLVVLLLVPSCPMALNLLIMCQANGKGYDAMATLMFWVYGSGIVTVAVVMAAALRVAGL